MKRPVLEVIRFEEPDIIATSGIGIFLTGFGDNKKGNGEFTFFGGTGTGSVKPEAGYDEVLDAFNSYFSQTWSSANDISVVSDFGDTTVAGLIYQDSVGSGLPDDQNYSGTYYYTFFSDSDGSSYIFRSN